jgi:hypothetical protein
MRHYFGGGWAGTGKSVRYDNIMSSSCGMGLTDDIRFAAKMIVEVSQREQIVQLELRSYLNHPQFAPYRAVLNKYGIGERGQALIISQIYPFSNYLDPETGKPIVIISKGKKSGKPTRKPISQRRFRKALGIAPQREQSGSSLTKTTSAGSQLCRTALWQWCFTRIEVVRLRSNTATGRQLSED